MSVEVTTRGPLIRICLNRPEKHNAFDDQIIAHLREAFRQAGENPAARVILLAAEGRNFSAGADLGWMRRMADMDWTQNRDDASKLAALMHDIDQANKPVVCRVQGAAFGGALGLIAASDIAIASDSARFCLSEVKLGILPAVISPYVVRAMGARHAQRYFMSAEVMDATEAARLGLVHEAIAEDALDARIQSIIDALLQGAPAAQLASRDLIRRVANQPPEQVLGYTAECIAGLRTADEGREGLDAFLQKRKPAWQTSGGENP